MDAWDAFIVAGVASIGWGLWLVHPPSMYVVVGMLVLVAGVCGSRRAAHRKAQAAKRGP